MGPAGPPVTPAPSLARAPSCRGYSIATAAASAAGRGRPELGSLPTRRGGAGRGRGGEREVMRSSGFRQRPGRGHGGVFDSALQEDPQPQRAAAAAGERAAPRWARSVIPVSAPLCWRGRGAERAVRGRWPSGCRDWARGARQLHWGSGASSPGAELTGGAAGRGGCGAGLGVLSGRQARVMHCKRCLGACGAGRDGRG